MACIFCRTGQNLTDEHVFPAFMGGKLVVRNGSCGGCNSLFGIAESAMKKATIPLLNLLRITNRDGIVPNAPINAEIHGIDLKNLPAFMDGAGDIRLLNVVRETTTDDGRKLKQGFFVTEEAGDTFAKRQRAKGAKAIDRGVPQDIVIDASYKQEIRFAFSLETRRVVAKIALAAIAFEFGREFVLSPDFDVSRQAHLGTNARDLPVRIFANANFMGAVLRTPHQHSVLCYLSAGMQKGWALVTLFGGLSYIVEVAANYHRRESKQCSVFYDAESKKRINPVVLADEMTLIGHVLSPATKFEDRLAADAQWYPVVARFCATKGIAVDRICDPAKNC